MLKRITIPTKIPILLSSPFNLNTSKTKEL
jgi:hypothetical protein